MTRPALSAAFLLALCWIAGPQPLSAADTVTIYRCTDARGKVQLRDSPCLSGQQQTTQSMPRFNKPPAAKRLAPMRVSAAAPAPPPASEPVPVQVVQAPRPMYECVTPDGKHYSSDTDQGNPRWMPLWALDYPVLAPRHGPTRSGVDVRHRDGSVAIRNQPGVVSQRAVPTIAAYGAGTWVRDTCHPLPQPEVCIRLRERRSEVDRRAFNAQPSERERLEVEERGINARLTADCGGV